MGKASCKSLNSGAGRSVPDNISERSDANSKGILFSPETESKVILIYFIDRMGEIAFVQSVAVYLMPVCVDFYSKSTTSGAAAVTGSATWFSL